MKRLETEWNDYRKRVISRHAPEVQVTESKRAFFSGAWALYTLIMRNLLPGEEVTPADLELIADLGDEMRAFCEDVRTGKA